MQAPITMNVLTVFQCTAIIAAYFIVMVALPAWALRKRLDNFRLCERFMVYIIFGNFSVINIVYALELVHLSYPVTLAAAYLALLLWLRWHFYGTSLVKLWRDLLTCAEKLAHRTLTWRQVWSLRRIHPLLWLRAQLAGMLKELPSVILLVLLMANVVRVFGGYTLEHYGYVASDLPVHNYWINGLIDNHPFIGGVYPLGYHCVVYFLHEMTRIPVFDFLRVMGLVQTFYFMLTLVAFLRAVCKTRFVPFLGLVFFAVNTGTGVISGTPYWRYIAGIPQEHGMIFLLPTLWTAFEFFRAFELERKASKTTGLPLQPFREALSTRWLLGFAMGLSLTISVHFYNFFSFVFFVLAGGVCYAARLVRPSCLWRVIAGGVAGVVFAVIPMAIAFALGTPLQGSIGWGLNVLAPKDAAQTQQEAQQPQTQQEAQQPSTSAASQGDAAPTTSGGSAQGAQASSSAEAGSSSAPASSSSAPARVSLVERLVSLASRTVNSVRQGVGGQVYKYSPYADALGTLFLWGCAAMLVLAVLLWIARQQDYAAQVATMSLGLFLQMVMTMAASLSLPKLMPVDRAICFVAYWMPAMIVLGLDGAVSLVTLWMRHPVSRDVVSFFAAVSSAVLMVALMGVQPVAKSDRFEPDGNILSLERILREFPNFSWTIVSANEELRMCEDYGYHTEINEVLNGMEQLLEWRGTQNSFEYRIYPALSNVVIPTEHVFFFVEKRPGRLNLNEAVPEGETISEEWARNILPGLPSIKSYRGKNRMVEMSRIYFWAEEFQKRFPNDMRVFYEDDEMVCFYLHQVDADYTDLSIDYGYNGLTPRLMLKEMTGEDPGELELGPDGEYHTRAFNNALRTGLARKVDEDAVNEPVAEGTQRIIESGVVLRDGGVAQ